MQQAASNRRWVVGEVDALEDGDSLVALDLFEARAARARGCRAVLFPDAVDGRVRSPASNILVVPPTWRGYAFAELLEWMVCARLGEPGASVAVWRSTPRGGATGVRRILERRGWQLAIHKSKQQVSMEGKVPEPGVMPHPATIRASLAGADLMPAAGWGVFAGKEVDAGTRLLLEAALEYTPVTQVADIGTGSGVLAASLLAGGHAREAVATDVDAVALYLARRTADAAGVDLRLLLEDDPRRCPGTPLTICNLPTHAEQANAALLVEGLARRTVTGPVLAVVHASLESRYASRFRRAGAAVRTVRRAEHSVLELTAGPAATPRRSA